MKRVFLYAYTQSNLGDDLFVRHLLRRYPKVKFFLYGDKNVARVFREEKNLTVIEEDSWLIRHAGRIRQSLGARIKGFREKHCAAVVYIGGSIFIEYENWQTILGWWEYKAENGNFYALGANFGPWHTEEYRRQMSGIFSKMKDVCFRDKYSKGLFAEVPTVRYAPDILLGYSMPKAEVKKKQAFISIIDCASKDEGASRLAPFDSAYTRQMSFWADSLIEAGWNVVFSSFCEIEGDQKGIEKIRKQMNHGNEVAEVNYHGDNTTRILQEIASSELIIATRFHAMVLGFSAGQAVIPVIYSDKSRNTLKDLSFEGFYEDLRSWKENAAPIDLEPALQNLEKQRLQNKDIVTKAADNHFLKLDERLSGKHKKGF